jgi:thiol-disulfide isomerase/thioredoxin
MLSLKSETGLGYQDQIKVVQNLGSTNLQPEVTKAPGKLRHRATWLCRLFMVAALAWTASQAIGGIKVGDSFPDLASFKLEGKLPDNLKGKLVLVDFWASWCEPCKASFPVMEELHKQYGALGLVIIAVNVDEDKSDMAVFLKKNPVTFTVVRDGAQTLVNKAGIGTMPSSFLIDGAGKVRAAHSGFKGEETKKKYQQEIESLLKK